jgi:hypothetical protein
MAEERERPSMLQCDCNEMRTGVAPGLLERVDHLVYATPDLDRGITEIELLLGVSPIRTGRHPIWGTHNALAALGPTSYLEILAPDPKHRPSSGERPFGLDALRQSCLATWAAKARGLTTVRAKAARHGVALGGIVAGSRRQAGGRLLTWQLTDLRCVVADGILPFFIDWGRSPHPASTAPQGAKLVGLRAEHPDADHVEQMLRAIGLDLPVGVGSAAALIAEIDCPRGRVELR